jgi:hypothetical protein
MEIVAGAGVNCKNGRRRAGALFYLVTHREFDQSNVQPPSRIVDGNSAHPGASVQARTVQVGVGRDCVDTGATPDWGSRADAGSGGDRGCEPCSNAGRRKKQ